MKRNVITKFILGVWLSLASPTFSFESEFLSVKTEGKGPDLVFIHGFASSPDVWSALTQKIGPDFRIHLVEVAGFAGSTAPQEQPESYLKTLRDEIGRYIEEEELSKPTLIGHSMGGFVSLLIASKETSSIGKVIVIDALPFFSLIFNPLATTEMVLPQSEAMETQLLALDEAQFEQQAKASVSVLTKHEEKKSLLLKWSKESDRTTYARYLRELISYDARNDLGSISCPVIVINAYDEAMRVPKERLEQLYTAAYANLKGVTIRTIPHSLHFIMWDQPDQFIATIQEVVETVSDKAAEKKMPNKAVDSTR